MRKQTTTPTTLNNDQPSHHHSSSLLTTNNANSSASTTLLSGFNNNNKNPLEMQLYNQIGHHFTTTQNSPTATTTTLGLNLSNSMVNQPPFISPSQTQNNQQQSTNTPPPSSSNKTSLSGSQQTLPGAPTMNTSTNQQDRFINMIFPQQLQQNGSANYGGQQLHSSSLVQNLMMGLKPHTNNNQTAINNNTTNSAPSNIDLNQLMLQSSNQYLPNDDNTMTQLFLPDVNNYITNNENIPTITNNQNDELLQQIINTLQATNSSNMLFNNNYQNPNLVDVSNNTKNHQTLILNSEGNLTEKSSENIPDEHIPHSGSVELNQDPNRMYFPIACTNCRSRHKKCDKMYPSCSQCIKRGVDCLYRSPKKKGRHNQSSSAASGSNSKTTNKPSASTIVATSSNNSTTRYQPYPQTNKNNSSNDLNIEFPEELKRLLENQMGYSNNLDPQMSELLSNTSQLPFFQNQVAEKLNIAAYRRKTIELYEGVISLGYSLVDINLIEQALFESETIDSNSNFSPEILSLLYSIHAVTCQALGHDQQGFLSFQKSKNCLANFFDSWSNILVATTYCHLSIYCASKGDSDTAKFYLNFVDFYFGNRHKIDFDRLEEYVIDSNDNNSLRELMTKHADDPSIKNIMDNLGINSTEFLLKNTQSAPTRHIFEKLPKEADFKLLKFRILCGITLDACGKEQYPVMLRIDPPCTEKSLETSNDLSMLGKVSPEGTFHLSDGLVKMDSSNFKRYSFSSYFCKILADMHLYITGRIPKHVLHMLTEVQPNLENLSSYMEIIDNLSKIYREHEKRRKFNDLQLPLALCIFNLFVFGTKLYLVKEVYRKTKASTQKNTSPNSTLTNKGVLHFLNSEILKLSNVVTKCTTIENFELLKPNLMNSVASAAEVHLELLEALSEISHLPFPTIIETLELSNYFASTFNAQDIQNPMVHKQLISQFEQQLLDMIDLNINALVTWRDRYGNDKYVYLIDRMELFKQRRSNQLFESIQLLSFPNNLLNTSYNHEDNYSLNIPSDIQQKIQGPEIFKLANLLMSEIEKNKLN